MNMLKRTLAMLLVLCMVLGMVPFTASAAITLGTKPADGTVTGQPFDTTVSANHRIPGLVNHNGTLIAAADVRWNDEKDGGGLDIVVSRSTDGNTWNYTFPAYLGDNGNAYVASSSTMMDPLLVSDGETLYLLYDMFPAGYSLATWNTTHGFSATGSGFNSNGKLLLGTDYTSTNCNYYLDNGFIYDTTSGTATQVEGYTVDAWFNVYQNGTYVSNLFFSESPYYAYPTSYIAIQTSTDGGVQWSDPQLLPNIKPSGTTWQVLGPGSGLALENGDIAFTAYDNTNIYLIWGNPTNGWNTVRTSAATNESSIVELSDGTIRAFVKNNNNVITYVDFTKSGDTYTAGAARSTGISNTGWCMISSMVYSKTIEGEEVILVCCPNSGDQRYNGTMYAFKADSMTLAGSYQIDTGYNDQFFAYSDMAELENGDIALLYEDGCLAYNNATAGIGYSHISYTTVDLETALNVEFDIDQDIFVWEANNASGEIQVPTTAGVEHIHVEPATVSSLTVDYSAYDIVLCKDVEAACTADFACTNTHIGAATVTLPLTEALKSASAVKAFVVEADGSITSIYDVENDGDYVTFEAPHFSVVGVAAMTDDEIAQQNAVDVTVYVGETKQIVQNESVADGSDTSSAAADVTWKDTSASKTYILAGLGTEDTNYASSTIKLDECLYTFAASGNGFIVKSKFNPGLYLNTVQNSAGIPNASQSRVVTVANGTSEGTFYLYNTFDNGNSGYLYFWRDGKNRFDRNSAEHDSCLFNLYRPAAADENSSAEIPGYVKVTSVEDGDYLIAAEYNGSYYVLHPSTQTTNDDTSKRSHVARVTDQTTTESTTTTEITITGKAVGSTSVTIGGTLYNITVEQVQQDVTLDVNETKSFTIEGKSYSDADIIQQPADSIATLDSITATIVGGTKELVEITSTDDLVSGKQYLIYNIRAAALLTDESYTSSAANWIGTVTGLRVTGAASVDSNELWTLTANNALMQNGKYLTFGSNSASMADTETALTLTYSNSRWTISANNLYLTDLAGATLEGAFGASAANDDGNYWRIYEIVTTGGVPTTEVTFTGKAAGETTAVVGNTLFNITVNAAELLQQDVVLEVDETKSFTIAGKNYSDANVTQQPNTGVATLDSVVGTTETTLEASQSAATTIVSGKQYLLVNTRANKALSNASSANGRLLLQGTLANFQSTNYWKITKADGTDNYYVQDANGKYLTFSRPNDVGKAAVVDDPVVITITSSPNTDTADAWQLGYNGQYLNDHNTTDAGGYQISGDGGSQWRFYELTVINETHTTEVTFTGKAAGETTAIVGNTQFNITVNEAELLQQNVTLKVDETKTFNIDGALFTDADVKVSPEEATATLDSVVGTTSLASAAATSIVSGKQYLIVNTRAAKPMTNVPTTSSDGLSLTGVKEDIAAAAIWTIEGADGTYTVKDINGKYLTLDNATASVVDAAQNIAIAKNGDNWTIGQNGAYLNDFGGGGTRAAGYENGDSARTDGGSQWALYEVVKTTAVTFAGVAPGNTTAVVGNTQFNITVESDAINVTLYEGISSTFTIADANYSDADVTVSPEESSAKLVSVVGSTEQIKQMTPVTSVDGLVSGKQYLIVNNRAAAGTGAGSDPTHSVMTGTAGEFNGTAGLQMNGPVSAYSPDVWSIAPSGNGYTITNGGKYLYMNGNAVSLADAEQVLTLTYNTANNGWLISQGNLYLSDWNGVSSKLAHAYDVAGDGGNYWTIYEVEVTGETHSTEVTFEGVTAGTKTTATVGHVTYNITVEENETRNITLYVGVTKTDVIEGFAYDNTDSVQPDNSKAYIHSVTAKENDTEVVFSGVAEGVTTAKVGHVVYNITVENLSSSEDIHIVGTGTQTDGSGTNLDMTGKEIKSLRITEGASFRVGVDATDYTSITWNSADPSIATVGTDGTITAVKEGETLVTATITKDGVEETVSVYVTVVPSMMEGYEAADAKVIFYYIDQVHYVDPYYTLFISTENSTGPVEDHTMVMVTEGEVLYYERPVQAALAMIWTSDPWDGHALTYMAATDTDGQYYPLQDENGNVGVGTVDGVEYYKCNDTGTHYACPYHNILDANAGWQTALDELLEYNVNIGEGFWNEPGCDGIMSMSRDANSGVGNDTSNPNLVSSLSFVAERLPEVEKTVNGVLGTSGLEQDWELYQDGMYAEVGEHIYFNITITQEVPHSWKRNDDGSIITDDRGQLAALEYKDGATLIDMLRDAAGNPITLKNNPPYFYTQDLDAEDGTNDGYLEASKQDNTQDVTAALNAGWTQEEIDAGQRVLTYYVVYEIQAEDANTTLTNGVALDYEYASAYSTGTTEAIGTADARMNILGTSLGDVVVDFGLPVVLEGLTAANLADQFDETNTNAAVGGAKYGRIEITDNDDGTRDVTYIPESILRGYDVVYLMDENNELVNYFRVYPATTVFYEESFLLDSNNGWNETAGAVDNQTYEALGTAAGKGSKQPYGYDPAYADHITGSGNSYISANQIGASTNFTFTGDGFDLYANCTTESGYVAVTVKDANGSTAALYTVNTKVKVGDTPTTAGQGADEYHMPIVSVQGLDHGTYTVEIRKLMLVDRTVKIDGVRIYNTIADSSIYVYDLEDNPQFYELRDYVLAAMDIENSEQYGSLSAMASQIYQAISTEGEAPAVILGNATTIETVITTTTTSRVYEDGGTSVEVVVTAVHTETGADGTSAETEEEVSRKITYKNADGTAATEANTSAVVKEESVVETRTTTGAQDLLDNSPKNELFLYPGQSLAFKVKTSRLMQLGLKAPAGASTTYTVTVNDTPVIGTVDTPATMATSVDMFYKLNDPSKVNIADKATITSTGTAASDGGSANLVDGSTSTLYKFYDGQQTSEQSVTLTYAEARSMNAMAIAFENVGASDQNDYNFTYSILAGNGSGEYDTIVANATANRTDNSSQQYTFPEKTYSEVKIVMHSCTATINGSATNGWPAIAEFEVYSGVEHTVTVTNTGDNILSVTKLKVCDDPNMQFVPLTVEDIEQVLLTAGYAEPDEETTPTEPSEPEQTVPTEPSDPEQTKPEETKPTEPQPTEPEDTGCATDETCVLSKYSDIVTDDWYHDGIHFCVEEGLMNGMSDTAFAPNEATTRAQLVTILYRLMGMPKTDGKTEPFTDVAEGEWYYEAIVWAYSEKIVNGTSETTFAPNANVTREQVAAILHRFLIKPEGTGKLDSYPDAASVSDYAKDAMVWAVGEGLINGVAQSDGTSKLDPAGSATRAQIATILYRYLINA